MELWIRSQDRTLLTNVRKIYISNNGASFDTLNVFFIKNEERILGKYQTEERALEVLDEIQNKMHPMYFCKTSCLMKPQQMEAMELNLKQKYYGDFIVGQNYDEITPLLNDSVVYEMPEE